MAKFRYPSSREINASFKEQTRNPAALSVLRCHTDSPVSARLREPAAKAPVKFIRRKHNS